MSDPYWSQWDKADLDSWQGKDFDYDHDDDLDCIYDYEYEGADDHCPCGYYCFKCLGLSWHDFM